MFKSKQIKLLDENYVQFVIVIVKVRPNKLFYFAKFQRANQFFKEINDIGLNSN